MNDRSPFLSAKNARDESTPVNSVPSAEFDLCQTRPRLPVGRSACSGSSEVPSGRNEGADSDASLTAERAAEQEHKQRTQERAWQRMLDEGVDYFAVQGRLSREQAEKAQQERQR